MSAIALQVQGAGVHHNPTPGPAGPALVYGHVWVVLGLLARHAAWMYVRKQNLAGIAQANRPAFRTKLELAVGLVRWAKIWLGMLGKPLWVVTDGAYAGAPFLRPMKTLAVTVVSRLRKDANPRSVPAARSGTRGRPRIYGEHRIDLAKRGGQRRGWATGTFHL